MDWCLDEFTLLGTERSTQVFGCQMSSDVKWRITEETLGTHSLIDHLPVDGPIAVKLSTGSKRLTAVSLDNAPGIWQASLPATLSVWSQDCTYLGTGSLRVRAGFFDGFVARQVLDQQDHHLGAIIGNKSCPSYGCSVEIVHGELVHIEFLAQGTQLTPALPKVPEMLLVDDRIDVHS